jgi:hypothetical protein
VRVLRFWWLPPLLLMVIIATSICGIALTHYGPADFDAPLLLWFRISGDTGRLAGPEWTTAFWLGLTWLGDTTPRLVVVGLTIVVLLLRRRWHNQALGRSAETPASSTSGSCKLTELP